MATEPKLNIEINALVNGLQSLQDFQREVQQTRERLVSLNESVSTNNLDDFSTDLSTVATEAETAGQALTRMVEEGLSTATGQTAEGFREITSSVQELDSELANVNLDLTIEPWTELQGGIQIARTLGEQLTTTGTQATGTSQALDALGESASNSSQSLAGAGASLGQVSSNVTALAGNTYTLATGVNTVGSGFGVLTGATNRVSTAVDNTSASVGDATDTLDALTSSTSTATQEVSSFGQSVGDVSSPISQASSAVNDLLSALDTRTDLEINQEIAEVNAQLDELARRLQSGAISQAEFDRANTVGTERLQNLQTELNNTTGSTSNLRSGFMAFAENAMPQTTERVTGLVGGFQELTGSSGDSNASATLFGSTLGKVAGVAGLAATALIGLVGAINLKEAVDYSARLEALSQVMYTVGGNAGYSKEQLDGYEKEVKKLGISSSAAKNAIAQMAGAGLELGDVGEKGASQVARLAEAAKNLSIVAGIDASEAMENLIININQADTEGLRSMGIILDQVKAEEQFAQSLGISAGALTSKQKQQATMNFVLEGASKFAGIYADSLGTVEAQTALLSQSQGALKGAIGDLLLPAYKEIIRETNNFTQSITESINSLDGETLSGNLTNLATNVSQGVFGLLRPIVDFGIQISGNLVAIADAVGIVFESIVSLGKSIFGAFSGNITVADQFNFILKLLATSAYAIADGFKVIELVVRGCLGDIQVLVANTLEGIAMIVGYVDKDAAKSMSDFALQMKKAGVENQKASQQIVDDFANGESALQKFVNGAKDAEKALANLGKASSFNELNDQLTALVGKQKELSSVDLDNKMKAIRQNMDELKNSGQLTEEQITKLDIKMGTLSKNIEAEYSDSFKALGVTSSELRTGVTTDFSAISGAMNTLALNAKTTSQDFINAFTFSLDKAGNVAELNKLIEATKEYGERSKKSGADSAEGMLKVSEATAHARGKFEELFDTQLESAKSSEDFKRLATDVQNFGSEMVKAGKMTQEELNLKLEQVADSAKEVGQNLQEAGNVNTFQKMGVDIDVVRTGLSSATNDMTDRLDELLVSSETTASGFKEAFSVAFDQVENLDEWTAIKQKLDETRDSGKLMGQELVASTDNAKLKFQELLKAQIESANTKEKFDELKESIANAGVTGALSGEEMAKAYQKVQEKIDSAKVSVLELAQQQKELSDQQVALSQAEVDITRAKITESKAEIDYRKALNEYTKSGTEEARLELEARRLELQLAKERVILAQDKFKVEKANYEVLIAQQKQLNAEKALEIDLTNENLQSIAKRAKEEAEAKQLVATKTQETYNKQQMVVSATEQASLKARNLADNMKATAENASEAKSETNNLSNAISTANSKINDFTGIRALSWDIKGVTQELLKMGMTASEANSKALDIINKGDAYLWGRGTGVDLTNYRRVNELLDEQRKHLELIAEKEKFRASVQEQNAKVAQEVYDAQSKVYNDILEKGNRQIANAEAMAKGGVVVNETYDKLASNTLPKANQAMEEFKQKARDVANSALDASNSFISGNRSIQEELLQAQGKEEEALKLRFQNRKAELATEYELLKVKLMVAEATARSAGIDTSAITKALAEANKSYVDTLSALNELEKINIQKLADKKSQDTKNLSESAKKVASTSNNTASSTSVTPSTGSTSGSNSKNPVIINIGNKSAKVEASDSQLDSLIDVLNELKGRKS